MKSYYKDPEEFHKDFREDIIVHKDSSSYKVSMKPYLVQLPAEIGLVKNLKSLQILNCEQFQGFPPEIAQLENLEELSIDHCIYEQLPRNLELLIHLKTLRLTYLPYNSKTDWSPLLKLKKLKKLFLSASLWETKTLPAVLAEMPHLESLDIRNNSLKVFPLVILNMKGLNSLDISGGNNFSSFPKELAQLPKLESLGINASLLNSLPIELFELKSLKSLQIWGKEQRYKFANDLEKFWQMHQLKKFELDYIKLMLGIIKNPEQLSQLEAPKLLDVLACNIPLICNKALEQLESMLRQNPIRPLQKGDKIVFRGKIGGKLGQLKARLKEAGIHTASKLSKDSTHVVLGASPDLSWEELQSFPNLGIYTELMLIEQLNQLETPFLLEEPESKESSIQIDNVRMLLHSQQEESIHIGLELLHTGGFPKELLSDLFLVYKENASPKIRREVMYFVKQYASPEFIDIIKRRLHIYSESATEDTICSNLLFYCKTNELDRLRLVTHIYQRYKMGLSFALLHLNTADKKLFFEPLIKKGKLDLSNLRLTEIPKDLGQLGPIKVLDLSGNHLSNIATNILDSLSLLEELHLKDLFYINSFPTKLFHLSKLKKIIISKRYSNLPSEKEQKEANIELIIVNTKTENNS